MKYENVQFPNDVPVQKWPCPHCGAPNNSAAEISGRNIQPQAGDLIVCYYCGGFCEFDDLGLYTKLKPEEFDALEQTYKDVLNLARAAALVRMAMNEI